MALTDQEVSVALKQFFSKSVSLKQIDRLRYAVEDVYKNGHLESESDMLRVIEYETKEALARNVIPSFISGRVRKPHIKNLRILTEYLLKAQAIGPDDLLLDRLEQRLPLAVSEFFQLGREGFQEGCTVFADCYQLQGSSEIESHISLARSEGQSYVEATLTEKLSRRGARGERILRGWAVVLPKGIVIYLRNEDRSRQPGVVLSSVGESVLDDDGIVSDLLLTSTEKQLPSHTWVNRSERLPRDSFALHYRRLLSAESSITTPYSEPKRDDTDDFSCASEESHVMTNNEDSKNVTQIDEARAKKKLPKFMRRTRSGATAIKAPPSSTQQQERGTMNEDLGERLLAAADRMQAKLVGELLMQGAPINYQDRRSRMAAIHFAARNGDDDTVDVLLSDQWTEECKVWSRSAKGWLPSRHVVEGTGRGDPMPLARRLMEIEQRQATAAGMSARITGDFPLDDDGPQGPQ